MAGIGAHCAWRCPPTPCWRSEQAAALLMGGQRLGHVGEQNIQRIARDEQLVHRHRQRHTHQQQAGAKHPGGDFTLANEHQHHADHAAKNAERADNLHAANQRHPSAQIIQLANDFRVGVLQILMVQRANDAGQAQKAVGVGQQQQGDGRKQQGRGVDFDMHGSSQQQRRCACRRWKSYGQ